MKNTVLNILVFVWTACSNGKEENQSPVEGVYVTTHQSEYSKAMDTIQITSINKAAHTFYYVRRTGYRRISKGALGPYEHKVENSICLFNPHTGQLNEARHGRLYSLSKDGKLLVSPNSIFRRIQ